LVCCIQVMLCQEGIYPADISPSCSRPGDFHAAVRALASRVSRLSFSAIASTSSWENVLPASTSASASNVSSCRRCSSASHSLTASRTIQLLLRSSRSAISSIRATRSSGSLAVTTRPSSAITHRQSKKTKTNSIQYVSIPACGQDGTVPGARRGFTGDCICGPRRSQPFSLEPRRRHSRKEFGWAM
jgi:hypothetical protein